MSQHPLINLILTFKINILKNFLISKEGKINSEMINYLFFIYKKFKLLKFLKYL